MKRDDALLTAILSKLEARGRPWIGQDTVKSLAAPAPLEYHIQLCADAGFVVASPVGDIRLTWAGHDELERRAG